MARSIETDPYQNYHFILSEAQAGQNLDRTAGFMSVTIPDINAPNVTYREGTTVWTLKFPGIPEVGEVVMKKGVFKKDSDFYKWMLKPINGRQTYRGDLIISEFHIGDELGLNGAPSRVIKLYEAFPTYFKPGTDKDATDASVSVTELRLAVEEISVEIIA